MVGAWILFGAPSAAAVCEGRHTSAEVAAVVDGALLSYGAHDTAAFDVAAAKAVAMADCLTDSASPELVAALHRVGGLRLVVAGSTAQAVPFLAASIALQPAYRLPDDVAPRGGDVDKLWTQATTVPHPPRAPFAVPGMTARIDGIVTDDRPAEGPYLVQLESSGRVGFSAYLVDKAPTVPDSVRMIAAAEKALGLPPPRSSSSAPLPTSTASSSSSSAVVHRAAPSSSGGGGGGGKGLLWAGVASGGLAAGLYGTAAVARLQYDQGPTATTHTLTNGAYFSSIGTAALSGALITTFLVTR